MINDSIFAKANGEHPVRITPNVDEDSFFGGPLAAGFGIGYYDPSGNLKLWQQIIFKKERMSPMES